VKIGVDLKSYKEEIELSFAFASDTPQFIFFGGKAARQEPPARGASVAAARTVPRVLVVFDRSRPFARRRARCAALRRISRCASRARLWAVELDGRGRSSGGWSITAVR